MRFPALGGALALAAAVALPPRMFDDTSPPDEVHKRGCSPSFTKKGPGRVHRHGFGGRPHGIARNLFEPGSLQMRAAQEKAAARADLYLNASARRRGAGAGC